MWRAICTKHKYGKILDINNIATKKCSELSSSPKALLGGSSCCLRALIRWHLFSHGCVCENSVGPLLFTSPRVSLCAFWPDNLCALWSAVHTLVPALIPNPNTVALLPPLSASACCPTGRISLHSVINKSYLYLLNPVGVGWEGREETQTTTKK